MSSLLVIHTEPATETRQPVRRGYVELRDGHQTAALIRMNDRIEILGEPRGWTRATPREAAQWLRDRRQQTRKRHGRIVERPAPKPFFTAEDPGLGQLFYFTTETAARDFQAIRGGYILETTKGSIWRVTVKQ